MTAALALPPIAVHAAVSVFAVAPRSGVRSELVALDMARLHHGLAWLTVAGCALACIPAALRWLRVAQREHYLFGSVSRFAWRWWVVTPNPLLAAVAVAAAVWSLWIPALGLVTAVAVAVGPLGLGVHGRTSPLRWTPRLVRLAVAAAVPEVVLLVAGAVAGPASPLAVVAVLVVPFAVDLACAVTGPLERRLSHHFVDEAAHRLASVSPVVVAVTGSYGKTSTKNHIAHVVGAGRTVVATPASFNNRAGLARAINEHLAEGTQVFVAEMGTYGPGEIADLCRWCKPNIAVITAIGPVHLERFGSEERILQAKSEILEPAEQVILPVDDPRLGALADRAAAAGKRVTRCSTTDRAADVYVGVLLEGGEAPRVSVSVHGEVVGETEVPAGAQLTNLACTAGVALALGIDPATIVARLRDLPDVDHRLSSMRTASGVVILDDTYNANPAGASAALRALAPTGGPASAPESAPRRLAVVTPGMVELGPRQFAENRDFATAAARVASDLLIVGRTNRRALESGARAVDGHGARVVRVRDRDEAVDWVRSHLTHGDAVLYENDLPDHYP